MEYKIGPMGPPPLRLGPGGAPVLLHPLERGHAGRGALQPHCVLHRGRRPPGEVLGYAGLHVVLDEGYIDNVAVRPSCRRQGIADRLLDVFCRFGQAKLAFLTLEVRPSNTAAVALYEKHGFQEAGRRKDYYENPKEDALLLTRQFAP